MTYQLPDYSRSSLSINASITGYFGAKSEYPTLPEIDRELARGGINKILLVLCDGMGEYLLKRHLGTDSFLVKRDVCSVSAVFPSTTTAATTSIWTGLSPIQHGWLGWSLYFKECAAQIDTFIGTESKRGDRYPGGTPAPALMPLPAPFRTGEADAEVIMYFPFPSYSTHGADKSHVINDFEDQLRLAVQDCSLPGKKIIGIYNGQPDHTMHSAGVNAPEAVEQFRRADRLLEQAASELPSDTLMIVTADHGLVDATQPVLLNEIPEINDCLWMPPSIEARCAACFVKSWKKAQFEAAFEKYLAKDFVLFSREEALEVGLMGKGAPHPKSEDYMGDYLICATGPAYIRYDTINCRIPEMIGMHAGLTKEEMTVPVILVRGGRG